ncbi:hypothetical protein DPMN_101213 [Dreissena polymorpha]|uniref:Uncharacterized protein n=1 Tax=Dreissena polymorpha TaxID=45954 RepID=A0A9D4R9V7_DREPO|nr:hypothetical protein DPMN_101213 [Dreissena polymorpha]
MRRNNKQSVKTELMDICENVIQLKNKEYTSLNSRANNQKANREARKKTKETKEEPIE